MALNTYKVEIQEFLSKIIEIEANNIEEALMLVKKMYQNEDIVLDSDDYVQTEIKEFPSEKYN